ncbi:uncharacterized protein A4U43_C10F17540 [Asparagus officinalis]|uniref:TF-B3 domain-containing protein n=1 Tax=Asparagus officinalis TaxID=4686 RepID=A0A5P1E3H6_ASPOF|nr:B3 domain-containing protein Os01g0905400-like [Asparagus officinalis]ONK57191.1 uncharacterized protein A4U43_C10F17540 [Asparagus officinalis]
MQRACKKCIKKCLRAHGEKPSSSFSSKVSAVPSFFKIMIGDFGEALFIPPTFARTLQGLINKKIYLEDSAGNRSIVKLSATKDGSLIFKQGWHDFILDHSISLGEIVIFKHIGISQFTVQIYGTSGSERFQFKGEGNNNKRKRKESKNEASPNISPLSKAKTNCEASERNHNASDEDAGRNSPIVLSDDDKVMEKLTKDGSNRWVKKSAENNIENRKKNLIVDKRTTRRCLYATERKSSNVRKEAECEQEIFKIPPGFSWSHKASNEGKTSMNKQAMEVECTKDMKEDSGLEKNCSVINTSFRDTKANEKKLADQCNSLKRPKLVSRRPKIVSTLDNNNKDEMRTEIDDWAIVTSPLSKEKLSVVEFSQENNVFMKDQIEKGKPKGDDSSEPNSIEKSENEAPQEFANEDEDENRIVSKEFGNEDSKDEVEVKSDATISLLAPKEDCKALGAEKEEVTSKGSSLHENGIEAPSCSPILNCKDNDQDDLPLLLEGIINDNQSEGKLELDDKKVSPCSKGEASEVVKAKEMDPIDSTTVKNTDFSITVSLISQTWLLLPEKLPACPLRKRCLRKVVVLQDPSMRLWPVLYHESFEFIGFIGGWEDFATANKLQQGDTCQIELVSSSEPTFKVQFSSSQNPM